MVFSDPLRDCQGPDTVVVIYSPVCSTQHLLDRDHLNMAKLARRELSQDLMRLTAKERLTAILSRADAEAVVAALPVQDFFFFVKEIGPDDASPLLALGQVEQLIHLFDLEWRHISIRFFANMLRRCPRFYPTIRQIQDW